MFGLLFWSSLWVVLLCMWFSQKNEAKFKKNIVLGATLPYEAHEDPEVQQILIQYRKHTNRIYFLLAVLCVAGAFIPDMAVSLICWSVMLILDIVLPVGVFVRGNQRLKALKQERGWQAQPKQLVRIDVSTMISYPRPKAVWYVLAAALCMVPMVLQPRLRWAHALSMGLVVLSYCFGAFFYRKKSEMVDENQELTKTLSRLRYRMWNRVWTASAYSAVLVSYSLWAMELFPYVGLSLVVLTALGFGGYYMALAVQTRRIQEKLTAESGREWYVDEDDYWPGGLFYYNPNDSHILVNARTGMNSTFNLASTGGKIITGLGMVILVAAIAFTISIGLEDKSNIVLDITEQEVFCKNGSTRYEVPLDEIEEIELLNEMPEGLLRTNALGGQHLFKGSFTGSGMSDLKIIADPTSPPYLKIKTASGQYYLFGSRDAEVAARIFAELNNRFASEHH